MSTVAKTYVDNAVQTTFPPPSSPSPHSSVVLGSSSVDFQSHLSQIANDSSLRNTLQPSPEIDYAYNASFTSYSSSPAQSITTSRRALKPQQLPAQFPSQASQVDTPRIASLPETMSLFSAKSQLDSASQRIVSMPENIKTLIRTRKFAMYSSDYNDISTSTVDSFVSGDGNRFLVEASSRLDQIPCTPSPPSSPESVVIIDSAYNLSEMFLRNNNPIRDSKHKEHEGTLSPFLVSSFTDCSQAG